MIIRSEGAKSGGRRAGRLRFLPILAGDGLADGAIELDLSRGGTMPSDVAACEVVT